jgi:hypothetical protein
VRQLQWGRAGLAYQRAAWAAARAIKHEALIVTAPESMRPLHVRMAALYRGVQRRHLVSARAHQFLAARVGGWHERGDGALMPVLLSVAAKMAGADSAVAALRGRHGVAGFDASDAVAHAAHDAETLTAEGPLREATERGQTVVAAGPALMDRWPHYGAVVSELGVAAVIAAPLSIHTVRLGALCVLRRQPTVEDGAELTVAGIAAALTGLLLEGTPTPESDGDPATLALFGGGDSARAGDVINQAAGIASVQCGGDVRDGADLLAARAFAEGLALAEVARRVVRGEIDFSAP